MIPEPKGKEIVSLLERNITVTMHITIGTRNLQKYVSRTSVVFVSISFIVLMIISLAWLVFYYIQRFRYANARDRNQRRLGDAAKKAISKLQVRTIRKGDKETESDFDNCAVCIEGYKPNDVVRILPCRHLFHKSCVDPWLLDHRTCPMCKMNILKALGIPPNADCMDDLPIDFEGSLGGPPTNQITGASDTTVNESSVTLDPAVRTVGALQVVQDPDPVPQEGEAIFTTNTHKRISQLTSDEKPHRHLLSRKLASHGGLLLYKMKCLQLDSLLQTGLHVSPCARSLEQHQPLFHGPPAQWQPQWRHSCGQEQRAFAASTCLNHQVHPDGACPIHNPPGFP
ncbi:ring finger protein 150 [Cricetulus griseus]